MDADRLERSAQFLHSTTLTMGSIVIGAVGLDKVSASIDVGDAARMTLLGSLLLLLIAGLAGGRLILHLPESGDAPDVLQHPLPLIDLGRFSILPLTVGFWRGLQHWAFLGAILCIVASAVVTARIEDLSVPTASAVSPPSSSSQGV
jgi:hypothetical protein